MPTMTRYLGCSIKTDADSPPTLGTCASLEGEWDTQAQIWYEGNLASAATNYLFWGDTVGEISIWQWALSPSPVAVEVIVDTIFSGVAVTLAVTQGRGMDTPVVNIGGCYAVGSAKNNKAERMGDRLYFQEAAAFKILS